MKGSSQMAAIADLPNPLVRWRRSIGTENHVSKNYAVGLEISCPGGAYYWAPEIPSSKRLAGATPSTCELAHNRGSVLSEMARAQIHTVGVRIRLGRVIGRTSRPPCHPRSRIQLSARLAG
jgi:hypothetical protein